MTQRLILASNNAGKLKEFAQLLGPIGFELHPQGEFNVPEAEEPFGTFVVNALRGAPGVYSARYAGEPKSDARNNEKLVVDLAAHADKSAYYYCVLVYVRHADDPQPVIADGIWRGQIVDTPRGANGFGYDPHFLLPEFGRTAAELAPEEKNAVSHRGQALRALVDK